jgi:3-oxoacyl-[acyl-carrier protein] reductase
MGFATARLFAAHGAQVVVLDIKNDSNVDDHELVDYLHCDLSEPDQIAYAFESIQRQYRRVDVLFNNAGAPGPRHQIQDITPQLIDDTLSVNLRAVMLCTKHGAALMEVSGGGSIINSASSTALRVFRSGFVYAAAKAGVINFTQYMAFELGPLDIRVNVLVPGYIYTPIYTSLRPDGFDPESFESPSDPLVDAFSSLQPLAKMGKPLDAAAAALFLASDDARWVSGAVLPVDGGLLTRPPVSREDMIRLTEALEEG